jgi:tetratricopeptide (TPR) repeat protein
LQTFIKIISILILALPVCLLANSPYQVASDVFNRLYEVHGHFNPKKPKLQIVKGKKNVARYLKYNNTIELEEAAYLICRGFGKDSLDALAFILGHELIHAVQVNHILPKTSFISYDQIVSSSLEIEQDADIQGIFTSYLAGFKTIDLIPSIIDKMYEVYELKNKHIRGYPSETERKHSYKQVADQANNLIELFLLANQMTRIGEYTVSIQCLEYISRLYQGREIFNNLGINYTLLAMNHTRINSEPFIYPIELDWNIRIKKPKTGRGDDPTETLERIQQMQYFNKAKSYFSTALDLSPKYFLAELNIFSLLIMKGELESAQDFYTNRLRSYSRTSKHKDKFLKIKSANAILLAKTNKPKQAISIWTDLSMDDNKILAHQAQNLSSLQNNKYIFPVYAEECISVPDKQYPELKIKLRDSKTDLWIQLDSENGIEKKSFSNYILYSSVVKGYRQFVVQILDSKSRQKLDIETARLKSLGHNQWIYHCDKESLAVVLDEEKNIQSFIKYYRHKEIPGY